MRERRPSTPASIEAHARTYLGKFVASRAHLRMVLLRRAGRADPALIEATEMLLDRLAGAGQLDDQALADSRVRSLVRRGVSLAAVRARLGAKGLGADVLKSAVESLRAEGVDPTRSAACAFVRRRRLGAWRGDERREHYKKDLATMGRAGFPYDVSRAVLAMEEDEILEGIAE
ncbi:MAG: hypothetical protein EXR71_02400 [Myxococcales bacterium]|nr:hypothetical protein [Myxococcales bacterium]